MGVSFEGTPVTLAPMTARLLLLRPWLATDTARLLITIRAVVRKTVFYSSSSKNRYIGPRSKLSFLYLQVENFVHNLNLKETALKNTVVWQRYEHLSAPRSGHVMVPCQTLKRVFSKSPKTLTYLFSLEAAHFSVHSPALLAITH